MPADRRLAARVLAVARQMSADGLVVATAGNVSARDPGGEGFWVTPSGVDYDGMTLASIVHVDASAMPAGSPRPRLWKPSSDSPGHAAIYRARPDVQGIVHTHSPYATAFAVLHRSIPPLLAEAAGYLGGEVRAIPYLPPAAPSVAQRVADGLGPDRAILLPNHGVVAVGESVEAALTAARLVEHSARIALLAGSLGDPIPLPAGEVERMGRFLRHEYGQT